MGQYEIIAIIALILIVGFGFAIYGAVSAYKLRLSEERNIEEISILKNDLSRLRDKLQAIRLGDYKPAQSEIDSVKSDLRNSEISSVSDLSCYFCDELIALKALVCSHCARPNTHNLDRVLENDELIRKIMSDA